MSIKDGWLGSRARFELSKLIFNGDIDSETSPQAAFDLCKSRLPEAFKHYRFEEKFWPKRLVAVITEVNLLAEKAKKEKESLVRDRKLKPKPAITQRGYPRWEGSSAEKLLREDIDNGKHLRHKSLKKFEASRPEYQQFENFGGHVHQDIKRRKYKAFCKNKSETKFAEYDKKAKSAVESRERQAQKAKEKAEKEAKERQKKEGREALEAGQFTGDIATLGYRVVELKELCRERGLPISGNKAAIESRLNEYFQRQQH